MLRALEKSKLVVLCVVFCFVCALALAAARHVGDSAPAADQVRTKVNSIDGLTYVWIPPGSYLMGCNAGVDGCIHRWTPAHLVRLTKGFWMGQTPVTQAAYSKVMAQGRGTPSWYKGDQWPVEHVGWNQAEDYCERVDMRLPTEAEWEYAARGGTTGDRYGDVDAIAWYSENSGGTMHDVGQKQPNAYGLYDMLGNVMEWVYDWLDDGYYLNSTSEDPTGPPTSPHHLRLLRGTTWEDGPQAVRVWRRVGISAPSARNGTGFRCVENEDEDVLRVDAMEPIFKVEPTYPVGALQQHIQGTVRFDALIAKDGHVAHLRLISGHPWLTSSAREAAGQWVFRSTVFHGESVPVRTEIDVQYHLGEDGEPLKQGSAAGAR